MAQAGGLKELVGHGGTEEEIFFFSLCLRVSVAKQKKLDLNVDAYLVVIWPVSAASFFTGHYGCGHCLWLCGAVRMGPFW